MTESKLKTMGQQFGRRSWAEPWYYSVTLPSLLQFHLKKAINKPKNMLKMYSKCLFK